MKLFFFVFHSLLICSMSASSQNVLELLIVPDVNELKFIGSSKLENFEDKIVVLEFWATWCTPCIEAIPHFNELSKKYGDEVVFVSVNSHDRRDRIEKFMTKNHFDTYVAMDDSMKVCKQLEVKLIPQTFLIDKNGNVRWRGTPGQLTEELLDTFLKSDKIIVPEIADPVLYTFNISLTKDRSVSSLSMFDDDKFGWEWKNRSITNIIGQLYGFMGIEKYQYRFEGPIPIEPALDLNFKADSTLSKEYVYTDVIENLAAMFDFTITTQKEKVELWELDITNQSLIQQAVSISKNGEKYSYHEGDREIKVSNAESHKIIGIINDITGLYIVPGRSWDELRKYDLIFPKMDIVGLSQHLESNYGLRLEKINQEMEVKIIRFK